VNSLEKLQALKGELEEPPGEDAHPLELLLRTMVMTVGPMLEQVIPDDPEEIDNFLEWFAVKVIQCRSDNAEPLLLANRGGPPLLND
jgi:hypothetical protein